MITVVSDTQTGRERETGQSVDRCTVHAGWSWSLAETLGVITVSQSAGGVFFIAVILRVKWDGKKREEGRRKEIIEEEGRKGEEEGRKKRKRSGGKEKKRRGKEMVEELGESGEKLILPDERKTYMRRDSGDLQTNRSEIIKVILKHIILISRNGVVESLSPLGDYNK